MRCPGQPPEVGTLAHHIFLRMISNHLGYAVVLSTMASTLLFPWGDPPPFSIASTSLAVVASSWLAECVTSTLQYYAWCEPWPPSSRDHRALPPNKYGY